MKYFNADQIQRIVDAFPQEVKEKFNNLELKEKTPWEPITIPEKIVNYAINKNYMRASICMDRRFYVELSLESDNYNQPSEYEFKPILKEIEEELFNIFGLKAKGKIYVMSTGKEPDDVGPLYWGELDAPAKYKMIIEIVINS